MTFAQGRKGADKKIIDERPAGKAVHEEFDECLVWDESGEHTANVIEEILEALPTVDAVHVIRCKDCKFLRFTGTVWKCQNRLVMMLCEPNDFCSRAERSRQ